MKQMREREVAMQQRIQEANTQQAPEWKMKRFNSVESRIVGQMGKPVQNMDVESQP